MHVPKHFWPDTVSIACFLINRMPSSVLNWATPYHQLFPSYPLFPIEPKVFGCTCLIRDVRPQVSKFDPKSLKCIFPGYSRVQKGYRCYCPPLRQYFVSINVTFFVTFFETTQFSLSSTVTSQGEDDDLLVYTISSPTTPVPIEPPITRVYSRCQNPQVFSLTLAALSLDPI